MLRNPLARAGKRQNFPVLWLTISTRIRKRWWRPIWLEKHLKDDGIRIVESNEDILLYDTGHIRAWCTLIGAQIFRIR